MPKRRDPDPPEVELLFEGDVDEAASVPVRQPCDGRIDETGEPLPDAADPSFHTVGADPLAAVAETLSDAIEELRDRRATARGYGAVAKGSGHDDATEGTAQIVQATLVSLEGVMGYLASGRHEAAGLRLVDTHPAVEHGMAIYSGSLRLHRPRTTRKVTLRVYPTTSGNLTVLELLPERDWMPQTKRYLQAGVPAITELTDRIEAADP